MKVEIKFTPETADERLRIGDGVDVSLTAASVYAGPRRTSPHLFLMEADLRGELPKWSDPTVTGVTCEDDATAEAFAAGYARA